MVGWHHQLSEDEFEQTSGVGAGQGGLASVVDVVVKSWARLSNCTTTAR